MISRDAINPFQPGAGMIPPVFPGREHEQNQFGQYVNRLKHKVAPSRDIIICAPRGNGKTTLLNWLTKKIRNEEKDNIRVIKTTPDKIKTPASLLNRIALPGWIERLESKTGLSFKIDIPGLQVQANTQAGRDHEATSEYLTEELVRRCRNKPAILIIDEAHNLAPGIGQELLTSSQDTKQEAPFQLILAGTPGLRSHLNMMSATFWERNDIMQPGLLSLEDTCKAIAGPLAAYQVTFDDNTLETIANDSQGYPYFTQLWGEKLFNTLQKAQSNHVDKSIANNAEGEIEYEHQFFYQGRYDRLNTNNLIPAAARIAEHFGHLSVLDEDKVEQVLGAIELRAGQTAETVKNELLNEGYIWRANPIEQRQFHPGIPLLMAFINSRTQSISSTPD